MSKGSAKKGIEKMGKSVLSKETREETTRNATRAMISATKEPQEPQDTLEGIRPNRPLTPSQQRRKKETLTVRVNLLTKPSTKERLDRWYEDHNEEISINSFVNKAVIEALEKEGY